MKAWRYQKSKGQHRNHSVQKTVGSVNRNAYFTASNLMLGLMDRVGLIDKVEKKAKTLPPQHRQGFLKNMLSKFGDQP